MTAAKTTAGEVLFPVLTALHSVGGLPLLSVWQIGTDSAVDGIILDFGSKSLALLAEENEDSIELRATTRTDFPAAFDVGGRVPWSSFIGNAFGWGWLTINQQGYFDGVLLSFKGIFPQIVLNVVASSLKIGVVERM